MIKSWYAWGGVGEIIDDDFEYVTSRDEAISVFVTLPHACDLVLFEREGTEARIIGIRWFNIGPPSHLIRR
jgi:hypothetical protein